MRRTTVYLTDDQDSRTKAVAAASNRSQADVIRAAIDAYTGGASPRRLSIVGVGQGAGGESVRDRKRDWLKGSGEWRR